VAVTARVEFSDTQMGDTDDDSELAKIQITVLSRAMTLPLGLSTPLIRKYVAGVANQLVQQPDPVSHMSAADSNGDHWGQKTSRRVPVVCG
jgi:hypothetical protein